MDWLAVAVVCLSVAASDECWYQHSTAVPQLNMLGAVSSNLDGLVARCEKSGAKDQAYFNLMPLKVQHIKNNLQILI